MSEPLLDPTHWPIWKECPCCQSGTVWLQTTITEIYIQCQDFGISLKRRIASGPDSETRERGCQKKAKRKRP